MEVKMDLRTHISYLFKTMILIFVSLTLPFFFTDVNDLEFSNFIISLPLIILVLPAIVLHFQYYLHDRGLVLKVDEKNQLFEIKQKSVNRQIRLGEIKEVVSHARKLEDGYFWLPWNDYYRIEIYLYSGEKLSFSCLLMNRSFFKVFQVPIVNEYNAFPFFV